MNNIAQYEALRTFEAVKAALDKACSLKGVCALNDAVEYLFGADKQLLVMTECEWHEYTELLRLKVEGLEIAVAKVLDAHTEAQRLFPGDIRQQNVMTRSVGAQYGLDAAAVSQIIEPARECDHQGVAR